MRSFSTALDGSEYNLLYKPLELIKTRNSFELNSDNMEEANKIAVVEEEKEINLNVREEAKEAKFELEFDGKEDN